MTRIWNIALVFCAAVAACGQQVSPVKVERHRILYLSREYLRHSQYLEGKTADRIVAWGWRILEWPIDSAKYKEVVPENPRYRFSNGSAVMDLDGDGNQELIVGRYERENWKQHEILWYERPAGRDQWVEHLIAALPGEKKEMPHDLVWYSNPSAKLEGIILTIGRVDLYLLEKPSDPKTPWKRFELGRLPDPPQSGMRIADMNADGRPDIVTGMHWLECPGEPRTGEWKRHRYGDWDRQHRPWGGMNKHGIADFDGDGKIEIVVDEAESPEAKVAVFKRDPANPDGLWKVTPIDGGLYCPHSLEVADLNEDGRPDFIAGEMDAGGWQFPLIPNPRLYAYLNQGGLKFTRSILSQGWGIHEGKFAPKRYRGRLMFFGNSTTQPWFDGMITNLSTWTIEPLPR